MHFGRGDGYQGRPGHQRPDVRLPVVAEEPGTANAFFLFAAGLNLLAAGAWLGMNPLRASDTGSPARARLRVGVFVALMAAVIGLVIATQVFLR